VLRLPAGTLVLRSPVGFGGPPAAFTGSTALSARGAIPEATRRSPGAAGGDGRPFPIVRRIFATLGGIAAGLPVSVTRTAGGSAAAALKAWAAGATTTVRAISPLKPPTGRTLTALRTITPFKPSTCRALAALWTLAAFKPPPGRTFTTSAPVLTVRALRTFAAFATLSGFRAFKPTPAIGAVTTTAAKAAALTPVEAAAPRAFSAATPVVAATAGRAGGSPLRLGHLFRHPLQLPRAAQQVAGLALHLVSDVEKRIRAVTPARPASSPLPVRRIAPATASL
jgi:hypothetical protein